MNSVDIAGICVANSYECKLGDIVKSKQLIVMLCTYISLLAAISQCNNFVVY